MNRNLLFALCLLTLPIAGWAQNNQPPRLAGSHYPGTPYSFTVAVVNTGAPVTLTAVASTAQSLSKGLLTSADQPTVTLVGNTGTISWSAPQTSRIATKYGRVWVTLLANTTAIGAGWFEFVASNRAVNSSDAVSTIRVTGGISPAELSAVTGPLSASVAQLTTGLNGKLSVSLFDNFTATQNTTNTNLTLSLSQKAAQSSVDALNTTVAGLATGVQSATAQAATALTAAQSATATAQSALTATQANSVAIASFQATSAGSVLDGSLTRAKLDANLQNVLKSGSNLLDKTLLVNGSVWGNGSGSIITDANTTVYKRYPLLQLKPNTTYTLAGINTSFMGWLGTSGAAVSRLNTIVGGVQYTTFTFTTDATNFYLRLNPSSVETTFPGSVDNTMMLVEGSTVPASYIPYRAVEVNSAVLYPPVATAAELSSATATVAENSAQINSLAGDYNKRYSFGSTSAVNLPVSYTLNNVGDYIEWNGALASTATAPSAGLGLFGKFTSGTLSNKLGYFSATQVGLRGDALDTYITWTIPGGVYETKTYRLEVVSGGWQLSVNGAPISTQAKPRALIINNIGSSYSTPFLGTLNSYVISTSAASTTVVNPKTTSGAVNVAEVLEKKQDGTFAAGLAPVYVTYNPTGLAGRELFTIYVKYSPTSLFYAGYQVAHVVDTGIRADVWRIYQADLYKYVSGAMIAQGRALQTQGESEFVYQVDGKTDATSGFHGDEKLTSAFFYIDGQRLTSGQLASAFTLTPASVFHYEQTANIYQTDNVTDVIQATHRKITTFNNAGYTTDNTCLFSASPGLIDVWYSGISCITLDQSGVFYTENLNYTVADGVSGPKINEVGPRDVRFFNAATGLSARVSSTITRAVVGGVDRTAEFDAAGFIEIYESAGLRTKYYRKARNFTPVAGDRLQSITTVTHYIR
ncbi:hypothetical protein [Spirosoma sp. 209]|uniref:hypothetical protein n=1 Tax=Spirosoma sp. 209 TaxID=1955701 RepID=UPI00098D54E7|nr:hypothetical protein [Spirosoma sp. 209]